MSVRESDFIEAINANPDDRTIQLVYADWLDERDDPRGMAWRVLIEAGKRPFGGRVDSWDWYSYGEHGLPKEIRQLMDFSPLCSYYAWDYDSFFAAMNAAAVAWVRANRPELASLVAKDN